MKATWLRRGINLWPPFIAAGIRLEFLAADFREARVAMPLRWHNRNYVRTHFGGSLFAMTDPFYMIMLMRVLGRDYHVWDRAANIEFLAPGRGTVHAHFALGEDRLAEIRERTAQGEKFLPEFVVEVKDEAGTVVARVRRQIYVRLKPQVRPEKTNP
ncbi:acyl-CoA thioesterase [Burkholderiales bacterium]|nr:acyl-CoA thioesterase [Burkholderiales bacterium]